MSGGSMDYLYMKVQLAEFTANTPERIVFFDHLQKVAKALRAIEWVDSGDDLEGSENAAIRECVADAGKPIPTDLTDLPFGGAK